MASPIQKYYDETGMPKPYTVEKFKDCKAGDILEIHWEGRNGELNAKFSYYGINPFDNSPLLIDVRNMNVKTLKPNQDITTSYSRMYQTKPVVFFDTINPEFNIKKIERLWWLPSYETDSVYGLEGMLWTKAEDGSIITY